MKEQPAKGVKGFLLWSPVLEQYFFRVYEGKSYKDYKMCVDDLEIEILDRFTSLYENGKLDYSSKTLGKTIQVEELKMPDHIQQAIEEAIERGRNANP